MVTLYKSNCHAERDIFHYNSAPQTNLKHVTIRRCRGLTCPCVPDIHASAVRRWHSIYEIPEVQLRKTANTVRISFRRKRWEASSNEAISPGREILGEGKIASSLLAALLLRKSPRKWPVPHLYHRHPCRLRGVAMHFFTASQATRSRGRCGWRVPQSSR